MVALMVCLVVADGAPTGATPYELDRFDHAAATLSALAALGVYTALIEPELPGGLACDPDPGHSRCDPNVLNELDRTVVGNDSKEWRRASDVGMWSAVALSAAGLALDALLAESDSPAWDLFTDSLVVAEATALAMVITQILKIAVRRPRPNHYTEGAPVGEFTHTLSFPSGHTATATAISTAFAVTFGLRHPESPWRFVIYGAAAAVSVFTGYGRIAGGRHFYTDVFASLAIGAASGILIPYWHLREDRTDGEAGTAVTVSPVAGDGTYGFGLTATF